MARPVIENCYVENLFIVIFFRFKNFCNNKRLKLKNIFFITFYIRKIYTLCYSKKT